MDIHSRKQNQMQTSSVDEHLADLLEYRRATVSDYGYIVSSFSRSYSHTGIDSLKAAQRRRLAIQHFDSIKAEVDMWVAALPTAIVGWLIKQGPVLHYVYVRKPWRNLGVAKHLMRVATFTNSPIPCSYWTTDARKYLASHPNTFRRMNQ